MSILDDAIREHLELKRAHGADEAEVKKLEDEAFGPPGRPEEPDPFAEAPTEFLTQPEPPAPAPVESPEEGGRGINIADLQEPPASVEPQADAAPMAPAEDPAQAASPAEEEPPALEHDVVPAAEPEPDPIAEADSGHNTEERHAIAEQPTEFFDIEAEMGTEDAPASPAEAASPSDEQLLEAEAAEPLAPVEPPTEIHATRAEPPALADEEEEDDDFWSEQRLSDELDQALEAPVTEAPVAEAPATEAPVTEEHEAPAPPPAAEPAPESPQLFDQVEGGEATEADEARPDYDPDTGHEDVLEDTPEFLEDAPEDDELWFEQRPPKDFDFDD
jgi:hypothetical protein